MPSFYSPDLDQASQQIILQGTEYHHLAPVLRHKPGDVVRLNSGKGWLGQGVIKSIDKSQASLEVVEKYFTDKPKPSYSIAFSLLRNKNDEWLIEKVTELGAAEFFPVLTRYAVRNPSANTLSRFKTTALSAIKQCDNPWLPVIHPVYSLKQALTEIRNAGYVPVVASEQRPDTWMDNLTKEQNYCFIIGPEGGFDQEEFALMAAFQVDAISISSNVLRAETAAIAVAAQFNLLRKS
jgi:16S rRNA (uracil1498-N3)-methyltransferase